MSAAMQQRLAFWWCVVEAYMLHLSVAFAPCSWEAQAMQMQMNKLDKRGLCQVMIRIIRLDCRKTFPYDTVSTVL